MSGYCPDCGNTMCVCNVGAKKNKEIVVYGKVLDDGTIIGCFSDVRMDGDTHRAKLIEIEKIEEDEDE